MDVRSILSHELLVGDYLGVISSMHHPNTSAEWRSWSTSTPTWADATSTRTCSTSRPHRWGVLSGGDEPLFTFSRLPDQTDTWQQHRIQEQQAFWERDQPK
jgi:hypothetical protein